MTTLRFPDDIAVSGDALLTIAKVLRVDVTMLALATDGDTTGEHTYDLKAGGWLYERADTEDQAVTAGAVLPAGVTGWATGTRWDGVR